MTKEELTKLLEGVADPVYKIESDLKMPKTTLQKALKGERGLSLKWEKAIQERFFKPTEADLMKLPIDYSRPAAEYPALIRQLLDRNSLLVLRYEIENHLILSPEQKKTQLFTLSFKLQRTKN